MNDHSQHSTLCLFSQQTLQRRGILSFRLLLKKKVLKIALELMKKTSVALIIKMLVLIAELSSFV
ncbi:hypothetical protein IEQ34_013875 [Dendrobium chrysotoxum]|uniref:Uncharacterized protein n=1 Tax=Dendrobium chrysotoxum TaxID=161865 RepID=A0AAV7GQL6_DENCH|nr:hypothetical protein IEQ34_013875 [Dendrobium chrysotoxum]